MLLAELAHDSFKASILLSSIQLYWSVANGKQVIPKTCYCSNDWNRNSANPTHDQRVLRGGCGERAKDGAAPELNPGRVHRRINTYLEVHHPQC